MESILTSTKKLLGIAKDYTHFDTDIIIHINSAFAISAAFAFADHLAFTMAFNSVYVGPVVLAKLVGGMTAVGLGCLLYRRMYRGEADC